MIEHVIENQIGSMNPAQVRKVRRVAEEPESGFYLPLVRTLMEEYGKAEYGARRQAGTNAVRGPTFAAIHFTPNRQA